jgi:hypothetical protein
LFKSHWDSLLWNTTKLAWYGVRRHWAMLGWCLSWISEARQKKRGDANYSRFLQ